MNYNYLRYFSVLAQTEHYTVAAARLGISQPSLSNAIHSLENDLGCVKLFEKSGRNIRLTEEGRFYREKVDAALQELHAASTILRDSRISAPIVIRLGVVSGVLENTLASEIVAYSRVNKRVRFHLTESSAENLMDLVRQEKLDMAIVDSTDRDRTLHFRMLQQRNFFAALPDSHPLAARSWLDPQELFHEPLIAFNYNVGSSFTDWASGTPTEENVVCTVDTAQAAIDLVHAGAGVAFIPDKCLQPRPGIRFVPLKNWHQALYMCILYDKWLEPSVWGFVEKVVKSLRSEHQSEASSCSAL